MQLSGMLPGSKLLQFRGALLLKMLWQRYRSGGFSEHDLEIAAYTIFLYGLRRPRIAATWPETLL